MRTEQNVKEGIACRAFTNALADGYVAQPAHQGMDFGQDYLVREYGVGGAVRRNFAVQVKYLNDAAVVSPPDTDDTLGPILCSEEGLLDQDIQGLRYREARYARLRLDLGYLARLNDRRFSHPDTLYVAANEKDFFFFWVRDLHDVLLRWLPRGDRRSITFPVSEVRAFRKGRRGHLVMCLHGIEPCEGQAGWLGPGIAPRGVDSYSNLGVSLFIWRLTSGSDLSFDVDGFWGHISGPRMPHWAPACFARFLGTLKPSRRMVAWAHRTLREWNDPYHLPVAFQIVAAGAGPREVERLLGSPAFAENKRWLPRLATISRNAPDRLWEETNLAMSKALREFVARGSSRALGRLVGLFQAHSYRSASSPFARDLALLAWRDQLPRRTAGFKRLCSVCQVAEGDPSPRRVAEAIESTNARWCEEDTWRAR